MDHRDRRRPTVVDSRARLGDCPHCRAELREIHLLISYETRDGPDAFAECPECARVVHPE